MNDIPNRAINWIGPEIQPLVLAGFTLLSIVCFTNQIWSKFKVLRLAQPERFPSVLACR